MSLSVAFFLAFLPRLQSQQVHLDLAVIPIALAYLAIWPALRHFERRTRLDE
jgi:hypothetical protein